MTEDLKHLAETTPNVELYITLCKLCISPPPFFALSVCMCEGGSVRVWEEVGVWECGSVELYITLCKLCIPLMLLTQAVPPSFTLSVCVKVGV